MKIRRLLTPVLLVVCCVAQVQAQQRLGHLFGIIRTSANAPIADAKVTIISPTFDRVVRAVVTGPDGAFDMTRVPSGEYRLVVSKPGVVDFGVQNVRVEPGVDTNLGDIVIGAPEETAARIPVVNSTSAMRGGEFSTIEIESLPLGGTTEIRTFDEFVFLLPGVAPAPLTVGVRGPGVGFGSGQFSVNGQRARSNNFTIDGSDNNDPDVGLRRQGFVALVPQSIESIQQFQVSTLLYDAESGRNFGGQINAVSKGGSNRFGGQAYGFFTNRRLNARNSFDYTGGVSGGEDPFTRMQSGFVVGGPVVKDRTQFLVAYEHQDVNASIEQHFATIRADERRFLGLPEFAVLRPFPKFPGNVAYLTADGATPVGLQVLSFYPLPNNPGGPYGESTYTEVLPGDGDGTVLSAKVSHQISDNHLFEARYNFLDDDRVLPSFNQAIRSSIEANTRTQNLSLILNSTLSGTMTNQLRASYGRKSLNFLEVPDSPLLFQSTAPVNVETPDGPFVFLSDTGPIGQILVEPYSPIGVDTYLFPQGSSNNAYQVADTMSWSRGNHALKFGIDVRRVHLNSFQDRLYRPQVTYGSGFQAFGLLVATSDPDRPFDFQPLSTTAPILGSQLAAFGMPSSVSQVLTRDVSNSGIGLRFTEWSGFVHDSWRVRPNFTVEAGLRYEFNSVPVEVNHRIENALSLNDLEDAGAPTFDAPGAQLYFDQTLAAYRELLGGRTKIYDADPNNFGPRIGFAWDPRKDGKMSIRGGYGVYFDTVLGALVSQSRNVFPTEVPVILNPGFLGTNIFRIPSLAGLIVETPRQGNIATLVSPGTLNQFGGFPQDFTSLVGILFRENRNSGGIASTLPEKDLAAPYSQHWHLSVEREMFHDVAVSVAYVGTKGTKLTRLTTPNLGPNLTPFLPTAVAVPGTPFENGPPLVVADRVQALIRQRPQPLLGPLLIYENSASSTYHALQIEARRRYTNGYAYSVAYSWSHVIDDVSDVLPIAGASALPEDGLNLRLERGSANFDVRHRVSASLVWDLPYFHDHDGFFGHVLGDWQIASMFRANTGQPFTLRLPVDANLDGNLTDRPSTIDGLEFFDGHGPQRVTISDGAQFEDFVTFPFEFSPDGVVITGTRSTIGRNTARADSFVNLDVALSKTVHLTETQSLLFRTEIFNALNRANYGVPVRTLFAPGFGRSVDTVNPARIIQFALKYTF